MMRRFFWFVLGVICGAYAMVWVRQKASAIGEKLTPSAILHTLLDAVKFLLDSLIDLLKRDTAQHTEVSGNPPLN